MKHLVVSLAFIIVTASFVVALPQQQTQQPPSFRGGATLVPIDVKVLDKKGQPITGLAAADFTVLENGVKQDVQFFESNAVPVDLIVLLDTSSSMGDKIGVVVRQFPKRGTASAYDKITLVLAKSLHGVVPRLTGMHVPAAKRKLAKLHLKVKVEGDSSAKIVSQSLPAHTAAAPGIEIVLKTRG